jgi:hypothetical protein
MTGQTRADGPLGCVVPGPLLCRVVSLLCRTDAGAARIIQSRRGDVARRLPEISGKGTCGEPWRVVRP